jgi:thiol-disulfide isomerase/thioredoxin
LDLRCERASTLGDNDIGRLVDRLKTYINESPPDGAPARLAVSLGMAAEESERPALAISIYRDFGNLLAPTKDNTIAGISLSLLGAARRLELVGKPFSLQGSTVANKPLDWKRYRGKVVLVDFFATWCGPCREEVPHILDCYKANRKRGFEVIAISIDRDRKPIEDYVEKEKLPWTILLDRNEARGTDKSLVTYYGIFAIPQMILVGKDGKVAALNVRGEQLKKKVDELLSTTESKATKS